MRHDHDGIQRTFRLEPPRNIAGQLRSDLAGMKAEFKARADATRQEAGRHLCESIHQEILAMSSTGRLALNLSARHGYCPLAKVPVERGNTVEHESPVSIGTSYT